MGEKNGTKVTVAVLGERLNNLAKSLFDRDIGMLPKLEKLFTNHLKHHEHKESKIGDRIFKVITILLQLLISVGILSVLKLVYFGSKVIK